MQILGIPILSLLVFFPWWVLLFSSSSRKRTFEPQDVAFVFSLIEFIISLPLFFVFDVTTADMQFVRTCGGFNPTG